MKNWQFSMIMLCLLSIAKWLLQTHKTRSEAEEVYNKLLEQLKEMEKNQ